MSGTKKTTPLSRLGKIVRTLLIIALLGFVAAMILKNTMTDPWNQYYAALAERGLLIATVVFAALTVVCNAKALFAWLKERLRRVVVHLKRSPSVIPLLTLVAAFLVYSLNLTSVSDTTARIQGAGMGLCEFCMMLFTLLSMVCMLNAFPKRKKANVPMLVVLFALLGVSVYCDVHYRNAILAALYREESPLELTEYITKAFNMLNTYMILIIVTLGLVVLLPIYSRLIRKINTSVDVEGNEAMGQIEIQD